MEVIKLLPDQKSNNYFCNIENLRNEEMNERNFSNHNPWSLALLEIWV